MPLKALNQTVELNNHQEIFASMFDDRIKTPIFASQLLRAEEILRNGKS